MAKPRFARASGSQIRAKKVYACDKCAAASSQEMKKTKCTYCNEGMVVHFDSKAEYRRWCVLVNLYNLGHIHNLKRQTKFELLADGGEKVGIFISDFDYNDSDGVYVVEDVKGNVQTDISAWKCRHFKAQYGYEVTLVKG